MKSCEKTNITAKIKDIRMDVLFVFLLYQHFLFPFSHAEHDDGDHHHHLQRRQVEKENDNAITIATKSHGKANTLPWLFYVT